MSFFKELSEEEWEKKKEEAAKYDQKEIEHASGQEGILTTDKLNKIALAQKKQEEEAKGSKISPKKRK